jgi:putative ABC transport system permease protein
LIIACANLANLTLVRTIGRWREFATKIALGAGQGRMIRQMAIETLLLTGGAAILGWWITRWSVGYWAAVTESQYQVIDYVVDARTLAYLVVISLAAAILLALAPILRVRQLGTGDALKGDARGVTQGRRGKHLSAGLVAGQMALAIVLLAGAGVLVRSFVNIVGAETGVRNADHVLVGMVRLPSATYPTPADRRRYFDRLAAQLKTVPGAETVSVSSTRPVVRGGVSLTFEIDGRTPAQNAESAQFIATGPNYLSIVGTTVRAGRDFNDDDRSTALPVAIVNESFAARYWPNQDPIGQRLRVITGSTPGAWRVVVGVAPNIMQGDALRQEFKPLVYMPFDQQAPARAAFFFVRTTRPTALIAPAVRSEVEKLDSDASLEDFGNLQASFAFDRDFMDSEHSELGKHAKVAPVFAGIALLLSAVGLVAVIAHSVSQRTKEIGVRMAIGAAARDIRGMVIREGMWPVTIGVLAGLAASLAVNRVLQSQLVGVSPYDPITMTAAPLLLCGVALLACSIPARRAMRVDPVIALRHE